MRRRLTKQARLVIAEKKAEFMKWMISRTDHIDKGIISKAFVDPAKKREVAERVSLVHARRNNSDPFAGARAKASVMNGWMEEADFSKSVSV